MFKPEFRGPIEGYVKNFLRKNYWRVQASLEFEDCMQEAHLVFLQLAEKYPEVDAPQWFMSLFKTSWFHHFSDLANADTDTRRAVLATDCEIVSEDGTALSPLDLAVGETDNHGGICRMIHQAPEEVRRVLALLLNAPTELLEIVSASWKARGKKKDLGNQQLCQMLGIAPGTDVVGQVSNYFGENKV